MSSPPTYPRHEIAAAIVALIAAIVLMSIKFIAYFLTGSASIFTDAMESIVNVTAAAFATYSLILAHRPADAEHPYGHGKIEFLSAGFEGGMILLAAAVTVVKACDDLYHGGELRASRLGAGLSLMSVTLVINAALGWYLIRFGRRSGSLTLEADGRHLLTDAVTTVGAVFALLLVTITGKTWIDPLAALGLAVYIALVGVGLLRRSIAGLMDQQDRDDERLLREILDAHAHAAREPRICGYHKLRHRHSGRYHWVDFHITVPADWDIKRGHKVASAIEYEIEQALGEGNATAHVEPCENGSCRACGLAQSAASERA